MNHIVSIKRISESDRMKKNKKWIVFSVLLMVVFFFLGRTLAYFVAKEGNPFEKRNTEPIAYNVETEETERVPQLLNKEGQQVRILLDAGHGGADPGKVGINGALEKDINLNIVKKLAEKCENCGIEVFLTRDEDVVLGEANGGSEKIADLNCRADMMTELQPMFVVSIHQNSYTKESVSGPQVFFKEGNAVGKRLAEILQATLIEQLKPTKERECKGNMSYYLLKKATVPMVIVECGFLSNSQEADLLNTDAYQEKIADAVLQGILAYIEEENQQSYSTDVIKKHCLNC